MIIHTKWVISEAYPKGIWYCYGTINGHDISFSATEKNYAKKQMENYFRYHKLPLDKVTWTKIEYFDTRQKF